MVRSEVIAVRVEADLKDALEHAARSEGHSASWLAERVLRGWLVERGFLHEADAVEIRLTGGNIRNGHFYLHSVKHLLPADVLGGSNSSAAAPSRLQVTFDVIGPIETDVAADKMILRERSAIRRFFEQTGAKEGDFLLFERISSHEFRISLRRK
ncbi:hypothetical protein [Roseomonas mucosa]|uniref:hypothetical protein n=1 Tax=Roseomonas mucosa TaxID=207340 RepID=UPI00223F81D5|nr:hypothetical protein [Roseomonas mucosa]